MKLKKINGFTLIELIIVILLIGILSGILFTVLRGPMQAYIDVEKRTRLVDIADTALQRMTREIRLALPNSIRITAGTTIEFLRTLDGGRYRAKPAGGAGVGICGGPVAQDRLNFALATDCFEVMGTLNNFASIVTGATQANCISSAADCLVIYNTGQLNANAYAADNLAVVTAAAANSVSFAGAPPFPYKSPRQRFFIVDTPVSFVCNGGQITRFDDYSIGGAVGAGDLLINQVTACDFSYDPGSASRAGLVTLSITIQDTTLTGASVTLLQQVHVDNQP
ncbi:MAG: prepilin-type N-terminal cleavage/methylation domain-containing protein [Proteobacteria bacterium]|nr:prepilin-type N-terminal cleavage/methylation domain-containing protein [Pseudomonadota bacterium]NOG60216.1 prepilin-type N-terminal cleavage/methylation domain-containing protein [Pseudomonadota bacterium]